MSLLLLLSLCSPSLAGNTADEAELNFELGATAYQRGDFETALFHFMVSNRLSPNRNVTFNIGRAYEALGRYAEAYRWFQDALDAAEDRSDRVSGQIEPAIQRLRPRVALFVVHSDPPGATVYVDRKDLGAVGVTPLDIAKDPGTYTLIIEKEGYGTVETDAYSVTRGSPREVSVVLEAIVGQVEVTGEPGATVHVGAEDAEPTCEVPCTVDLPEGKQILYFRKPGFRSLPSLLDIEQGRTLAVKADLVPITGTLVVDADERGALIEIDGQPVGYTPAVLTDVQVGRHTITVSLRGYEPFVSELAIDEDQTVDVGRVSLAPLFTVTAASRLAQDVSEAPASVTLIRAEEIRAFGYQSVYEAVAGVRGFYQTDDLTYPSLGIRGFSRGGDYGNRVLVTFDGHTMNDDQIGSSYVGDDLSTDLGDVQQIEVVRGPGSALYGSNALFGVLNLVLRDGQSPSAPHVTVTGAEQAIRARVGAGVGDAEAGAWASLSGLYGPGRNYTFEELADRSSQGVSEGADETTARTVLAKAWAGAFTVQGAFHGREKEIPTGSFGSRLGDRRATSDDYRGYVEGRYAGDFEATRLDVRVYLDTYRYFGVFPYGVRYLYNDLYQGTWAGAEPRLTQDVGDMLTLTLGAETRQFFSSRMRSNEIEQVGGEPFGTPLDERPTFQIYSAYGVADLHPGEVVRFNVGGRLDVYDTTVEDFTTFNPRVAMILGPGDEVFKLMGGTAFRAPSPYEYFYTDGGISTVAPDTLAPETILTGEAEWTHQYSQALTSSVSAFTNSIRGLIDQEVVGDVFRYANVDVPVRTVGAEAEVRRSWRAGWMAAGQVSWQRTRVGALTDGDALANSPDLLASLMAAAPLGPQTTLATKVRGESGRLTRAGRITPWACIMDVTVTGEVPSLATTWGLGVRNLMDWPVVHPGGADLVQDTLPQPGRDFFGTVTVAF